jgi:haloacetate dehalogenase
VLLLHGFPETSVAWRQVAPDLAKTFTVVAADLPGYGDSIVSDAAIESGRLTKRTMADALVEAMSALGITTFPVVGHDRGARVAYRLTLDHPARVTAIGVLDVIPILDMAEGITYEAARQMGHWFWLSQPSTAPETLVGHDPDLYLRHIIEQWGGAQASNSNRRPSAVSLKRRTASRQMPIRSTNGRACLTRDSMMTAARSRANRKSSS